MLVEEEAQSVSQLHNNLLEYYDASIRPVYSASDSTHMEVDLALQQIIEVVTDTSS